MVQFTYWFDKERQTVIKDDFKACQRKFIEMCKEFPGVLIFPLEVKPVED